MTAHCNRLAGLTTEAASVLKELAEHHNTVAAGTRQARITFRARLVVKNGVPMKTSVSGCYWRVTSTSVREPVTSTVFSIGSAPAYTVTAYVPGTTCGISKWPLGSARATYGDDAAMI